METRRSKAIFCIKEHNFPRGNSVTYNPSEFRFAKSKYKFYSQALFPKTIKGHYSPMDGKGLSRERKKEWREEAEGGRIQFRQIGLMTIFRFRLSARASKKGSRKKKESKKAESHRFPHFHHEFFSLQFVKTFSLFATFLSGIVCMHGRLRLCLV